MIIWSERDEYFESVAELTKTGFIRLKQTHIQTGERTPTPVFSADTLQKIVDAWVQLTEERNKHGISTETPVLSR